MGAVSGDRGDVVLQETSVHIQRETDIVVACQRGRELATTLGLSGRDQVILVIAISEVARNMVQHAGEGEVTLCSVRRNGRQGIVVSAQDEGPGIPDLEQALQDGYSTSGGLGLGLSGTQRLVDEFEIVTDVGRGTRVTIKKWK